MSLPFLKDKDEAASSAPIESIKRKPDSDEEPMDELALCAEELCTAIHAKDAKAVAATLRSMFEILESEPHEEFGE